MGFDLSGIKPCHPDAVSVEEPTGDPWDGDDTVKNNWKAYWTWVENTPGIYFRNNVWWWRPLWNYVCNNCDDILSEKDMTSGGFNDFHKISKTKAIKIANRLDKLIEKGEVAKYADKYEKKRQELKDSDDKEVSFLGSYPFNVDNVKNFAEFARFSGGFTIG